MNILLIEDFALKSERLQIFLKERFPSSQITICKSYQSGLKNIFAFSYDIVLLDMSLPTFDIKPGESGYKFKKLGGIDVLKELRRKENKSRVIIVTQWTTFERDDRIVSITDLKKEMSNSFNENYIGTVYYSSMETKWQEELNSLLSITVI